MVRKIWFLVFIISYLFFLSCNSKGHKKTLVIAGSTSVQPFVEGLAEIYARKNRVAEINVQGGGSSAGIQSALCGAAQIGMSSRRLNQEETSQLKVIAIAYDAVVVILNPQNKIDNISIENIKKIFSRRILNWKELGGEDKEINAITREDGSGTRGAFQELAMKETPISNGCMVQDSNGSVREIVKADPYAIGYMSMGLVNKDVKTVRLDRREDSFTRPFLFVHSGELITEAKDFVDFVLSREGQDFLENEGLIRVNK